MLANDRIARNVEVSYEGVFDLNDFLDFLKKWFKNKGYDITEKLYDVKTKGEAKSFKIKWECDRKPTDYDKFFVRLTIDGSNIKEAKIDGVKVMEGKINITFDADHQKDYDEKWVSRPGWHFLRAFMDKFAFEPKQGALAKRLKDEDIELADETKKYFNIK